MDKLTSEIFSLMISNLGDKSKTQQLLSYLLTVTKLSPGEVSDKVADQLANMLTATPSDNLVNDCKKIIDTVSTPIQEEKKEEFIVAGPWDYLKALMDDMGNGINWDSCEYRSNMELPPHEVSFRKMITAIQTHEIYEYRALYKEIISHQNELFNEKSVTDVAMRLATLYNNLPLLLELSSSVYFEPSSCLVHAVIGNSCDCFYFLLGSSKYTPECMSIIKHAFVLAVTLNRVKYAEDMYNVWGKKLDARYLGALPLTSAMKELVNKL